MKREFLSAVLIVVSAYCATGHGQHADIKPDVENGRIVTGSWVDAISEFTPNVRVFGYDFQEDALDPYFISDPGFNTAGPSGLPVGSMLGFNILNGAAFGLPGNLTYWNGVGGVAFSTMPNLETLRLNLGAQDRTATSAAGEMVGFPIGTIALGGSVHRHISSYLQGADGNSIPGDGNEPTAGIYLVALELTSNDTNIANGQPLFVVYNNGLSEAGHDAAIEWVEANLVAIPEPATSALCGVAVVALAIKLRRRW